MLEESPEFRQHARKRTKAVRRVAGIAFMVLLLAAVALAGWGLWSVREFNLQTQQPMRSDRSATQRLSKANADTTLLVLRSADSPLPFVAVLRQPAKGGGSWLLALPQAPLSASQAASETPGALLEQGRATLLKAVEGLVQAPVGHFVELDTDALTSALADWELGTSLDSAELYAPFTSPNAALEVVAQSGRHYWLLRDTRTGALHLPGLARVLAGRVVSDLGAVGLDRMLVRLGADAAQDRVQKAVIPVEKIDQRSITSTAAAQILAERMRGGRAFGKVPTASERVAPSSLTVTVLNGAGREGVAGQAARILSRAGYQIKTVGNANQFVYDKTLVVYEDRRAFADAVKRDLRRGKIVASRGMYSFKTDVLVIVGADWPQTP